MIVPKWLFEKCRSRRVFARANNVPVIADSDAQGVLPGRNETDPPTLCDLSFEGS